RYQWQDMAGHEQDVRRLPEHFVGETQLGPQARESNDFLRDAVPRRKKTRREGAIQVQTVVIALILDEQIPQHLERVVFGAGEEPARNATRIDADQHEAQGSPCYHRRMAAPPVALNVLDLSQNWDTNTPGFARYDGPSIKWVKRVAVDG